MSPAPLDPTSRPGFPPWNSLLLGFALMGFCFLLAGTLVSTLLPANGTETLLSDPQGRMKLRLIQALSNLGSWGLAALIWAKLVGGNGVATLQLDRKTPLAAWASASLVVIFAIPLTQAIFIRPGDFQLPTTFHEFQEWVLSSEKGIQETLLKIIGEPGWLPLLANIFIIALIPALSEELFFRGFLFSALQKVTSGHVAVWLSAAFFSFIHFQFLGFFSRLLLGALLGYFLWKGGSLKISIIAHFLHNLVGIIMIRGGVDGWLPQALLRDDFRFPLGWTLFATLLSGIFLYLFFRSTKNRPPGSLDYE